MKPRRAGVLLGVILVLSPSSSIAQDDQEQSNAPLPLALSDEVLNHVPPAYREKAKLLVTATEENQQRWLKLSDEDLAVAVVGQLARKPEASQFLLTELEKEPSAKIRMQIIYSKAVRDYWTSHQDAEEIIERHAAADPDAGVALKTLEVLRRAKMEQLGRLLQAREAAAKNSGDSAGLAALGVEEEQWFSMQAGVMLPAFLRVPPPVFSVVPSGQSIRVLAFGDFGTGSPAQRTTATAMVEYHKHHPFDFGLTLGDNFYGEGVSSPDDPQWKSKWEDMYGALGIKFYAILGNHDWGQSDSPAAEVLYGAKSASWRMPAPYYTFTAGSVQFFALDTVEVNEDELEWLDRELSKSQAQWRIVYGHFHIFSATRGDNKELIERLLPILKKNHVDVYLNGHDHNLQEIRPEGGVHFFVSGGGGAELYNLNPYERSLFKQKVNGFTVLEADGKHFKISFVGADGKELYSRMLTK